MEKRLMRLQGIGMVEGTPAKLVQVGDTLVWNYGGTTQVVSRKFSKTGKTLDIIEEYEDRGEMKRGSRKLGSERLVHIKRK